MARNCWNNWIWLPAVRMFCCSSAVCPDKMIGSRLGCTVRAAWIVRCFLGKIAVFPQRTKDLVCTYMMKKDKPVFAKSGLFKQVESSLYICFYKCVRLYNVQAG